MSAFIRMDNQIIRRRAEGISTLDDVGLYAMLSAFLSIPNFKTPNGGLQAALAKHCRNGRHTIHNAWLHLSQAGYLKRVRLPDAQFCLRDIYTLHATPDNSTPPVRYATWKDSSSIWRDSHVFLPPMEHYTPVSTAALMDADLSLAAKGLYAMIRQRLLLSSRVSGVTINREGLRRSSGLGECAFRKIWKELRQSGYLQLTHLWDAEKKQMLYRYDLSEEAVTVKEKSETEVDVEISIDPAITCAVEAVEAAESVSVKAIHHPLADLDGHSMGPMNQSYPSVPDDDVTGFIQDQIEYDVLLTRDNPPALLDCAVEIMARLYHMPPNNPITIRGATYRVYEIQRVLRDLDANETEYALQMVHRVMKSRTSSKPAIKHLRSYLLACLVTAKTDFAASLLLR